MDGRGSAARIGGDEFAILCDGIGARDEAIALGQEIQSIFATPFAVRPARHSADLRLRLCASFPRPPPSRANSCALADAALYRAKALGPGVAAADEEASAQAALSRRDRGASRRGRGNRAANQARASTARARAGRSPRVSLPARASSRGSRHPRRLTDAPAPANRPELVPGGQRRTIGRRSGCLRERCLNRKGRDAWRAASIM